MWFVEGLHILYSKYKFARELKLGEDDSWKANLASIVSFVSNSFSRTRWVTFQTNRKKSKKRKTGKRKKGKEKRKSEVDEGKKGIKKERELKCRVIAFDHDGPNPSDSKTLVDCTFSPNYPFTCLALVTSDLLPHFCQSL